MSPELLGRVEEIAWLRSLIVAASAGHGQVAVIRGDAGVGKTALLSHFTRGLDAARVEVIAVEGIESEADLPFAVLQRIVLSRRSDIAELPAQHAAALLVASGLEIGVPGDRLTVGMALLGLLTQIAAERTVVFWIDDTQWVDAESFEVFTFVGRRLLADRVVMLFSARHSTDLELATTGFAVRDLDGLGASDAMELLTGSLSTPVDQIVAEQIIRATGGNPLALIDLGDELTTRQLQGVALLPEPAPLGKHLETHYRRRIHALPLETQRWLTIAAAESDGDFQLIEHASLLAGLPSESMAPAEDAGLIVVEDQVRFRHPLIRSAIYNGATSSDLRMGHEHLSAAAEASGDADRRIRHRAAMARGVDEALAVELEDAASRAAQRGGYAGEMKLLMRAVAVSSLESRPRRQLAAAESAIRAGAMTHATTLIDEIDERTLDVVGRAVLAMLRTDLDLMIIDRLDEGTFGRRAGAFLEAARILTDIAPERALSAAALAFNALLLAGEESIGATSEQLALVIRDLCGEREDPLSLSLLCAAALVIDGPRECVPAYRRALRAMLDPGTPDEVVIFGHYGVTQVAGAMFDDAGREHLAERVEQATRTRGARWLLNAVFAFRAQYHHAAGRVVEARACFDDLAVNMNITGFPDDYALLTSMEARVRSGDGDIEWLEERFARGLEQCRWTGHAEGIRSWKSAMMQAHMAAGDYTSAWDVAGDSFDDDPLAVGAYLTPDLIEIAVRTGNRERATSMQVDVERRVESLRTELGLGLVARGRALLDNATDQSYPDAIGHFSRADAPMFLARTHLLYGEWLRRQRRRSEASEHLGRALILFREARTPAWAERAARELAAAGHTVDARPAERHRLTSQESIIARLAADGATNSEIAERLFVSSSTVDYHLRKVFRKLDVTSRRQLRADQL